MHSAQPARILPGASRRGVGEHPIGNDPGSRDDVMLLIDGLLTGGDPEIYGGAHDYMQQTLSDNPSGVRPRGIRTRLGH
jgi:hypothetical protein